MSATGDGAEDLKVQTLYERFPYPRRKAAEEFQDVHLSASAKLNHALYFPSTPFRDDLDILIAGCGTNLAATFSVHFPNARIVGLDISASSLAHSKSVLDELGVHHCELHQMPLEDVGKLERKFDFIHCSGVLHHLKSPEVGLEALGSVLREQGAMALMVYARFGREGLYQIQELCRRLELSPTEEDARLVQRMITLLPEDHSLRMLHPNFSQLVALEDIADMFLHPRDVAYTTDAVRDLVSASQLRFHRWVNQGMYSPELSPLWTDPLISNFRGMDSWQQAAAMELYYGTIFKHQFIVTHPCRPPAGELFSLDELPKAVPIRSVDIGHRDDNGLLYVSSSTQQVPVEIPLEGALETQLFKAIDGVTTVSQMIEQVCGVDCSAQEHEACLAIMRRFYLADLIYLSLVTA